MHDDGEKMFLGRTGRFDGFDIIEIILEQPATSRFLARKLLVYFVHEPPTVAEIEALAARIRATGYDMREVMRSLLASEIFYAPEVIGARVKSPVELVVGTVRLLEVEPEDLYAMARATRGMGQELFQPPNVKGWDGGRKWINTATIFTRYNFASGMLAGTGSEQSGRMMGGGRGSKYLDRLRRHRADVLAHLEDYPGLTVPEIQVPGGPQPAFDPVPILEAYNLRRDNAVLNHFADRLLGVKIDPRQRRFLKALLTQGTRKFDAATPDGQRRVISLVNALLTMPEYQVN
jgi:hypothetical protein